MITFIAQAICCTQLDFIFVIKWPAAGILHSRPTLELLCCFRRFCEFVKRRRRLEKFNSAPRKDTFG